MLKCKVCKEDIPKSGMLCYRCSADYWAFEKQMTFVCWMERRKKELVAKAIEEVLAE